MTNLERWAQDYGVTKEAAARAAAGGIAASIDACIRKWEGLHPSVLESYGLRKGSTAWTLSLILGDQYFFDGGEIRPDAYNCALCHYTQLPHSMGERENIDCTGCPGFLANDGHDCADVWAVWVYGAECGAGNSPCSGDTTPMLAWLKRAKLKYADDGSKK